MRTKYKPWALPYVQEHQEVALTIEQLQTLDKPFYLEIGSGKGQFLLNMANNNQDKFFIGVERNVTCCGFVSKKLVENEVTNAKLMFDNADAILDSLKDNVVEGIFLNHSDPWPKKRHAKRRLTAPNYLEKYYRVLKEGGLLIIKTDNDGLYEFTLETLKDSKFKILSSTTDYDGQDPFDSRTEYEDSFRGEGKNINRLIAVKKND